MNTKNTPTKRKDKILPGLSCPEDWQRSPVYLWKYKYTTSHTTHTRARARGMRVVS